MNERTNNNYLSEFFRKENLAYFLNCSPDEFGVMLFGNNLEARIAENDPDIQKKAKVLSSNYTAIGNFYKQTKATLDYLRKHVQSKEDMSERVPLKWLNILPETLMGGVLGFTYIGENFMGRRADLTGKTARMVDIHESIHTPDEYETRVITSWIMSKEKSAYNKLKSIIY